MDIARFESKNDEGLFGILYGAARSAAGPEREPVGVLEILPDEAPHEDTHDVPVAIEAAFAYQGPRRVVQRLDLRARAMLDTAKTLDLARSALLRFGAQKYTNFVLAKASASRRPSGRLRVRQAAAGGSELLDITVYFPSRLPWYSRNLLLMTTTAEQDLLVCRQLLEALGVHYRQRQAALVASRSQLRSPITEEQQLEALQKMLEAGLNVTLYVSALPATQSLRLESGPIGSRSLRAVDVCLSRGLHGTTALLSKDAEEMEQLLARYLGLKLQGRSWRVTNAHSDSAELEERGMLGQKSGLKWQGLPRRRKR